MTTGPDFLKMIFLALDPSKKCTGWAMYAPGWNTARLGHWTLGSKFTGDGQVFCKLTRHLKDMRDVAGFDHLYYEAPLNPVNLMGHTTIHTILLLAGLRGEIERFGYASRCRIVKPVNVNDWLPHWAGRQEVNEAKATARRLKKEGCKSASARGDLKNLTIQRARSYGFQPDNSDEADALAILDYALDLNGIVPPWRAHETLRPILSRGEVA